MCRNLPHLLSSRSLENGEYTYTYVHCKLVSIRMYVHMNNNGPHYTKMLKDVGMTVPKTIETKVQYADKGKMNA